MTTATTTTTTVTTVRAVHPLMRLNASQSTTAAAIKISCITVNAPKNKPFHQTKWKLQALKMSAYKLLLVTHKWLKKALGETQTLRASCSTAEPKIFAPPQTPFPGAQDGQNLIIWRWSLPLPKNPFWWESMHAISSYHGSRPPHTNPQTGPITIHCATKLSAQCNKP